MTAHQEASEETVGWELGIPLIIGGNGGSNILRDRDIRHKEAEYGHAAYCDTTDSGPLIKGRAEAGGKGVSAVVGTGQVRYGGVEEEGSSGIGQREGDM